MREHYSSHVCVYMCVCYCASSYIPALYVQSEAVYSWPNWKLFVQEIWLYLPATMQSATLLLLDKKHTIDMITNGTVYEPLARSDDNLS